MLLKPVPRPPSQSRAGRVLELKGQHSCTADSVEQELKGKRVSYTGEELGTCHPLTLDQVIPGLPPVGHGGSVDVLDLVSRGTSRILQDPSLWFFPTLVKNFRLFKLECTVPLSRCCHYVRSWSGVTFVLGTRLEDVFPLPEPTSSFRTLRC